jgi:pimeloyl-ACP methyl ester carboxylesterase
MKHRLQRVDNPVVSAPAQATTDGLDAAMLRAYPVERSLDYGCSIDDVTKLRARVEGGAAWTDVAVQLARDNLLRADVEQANQCPPAAWSFYLHAAACYRLAQAAMEDDPARRLETYQLQFEAFSNAIPLAPHAVTRFEVLHGGARHGCWLFPAPPLAQGTQPCVVVWGGADGWCEAFYSSVAAFRERGISVCLVELPGQGLARLRDRSALRADYPAMVSAVLDALVARGFGQDGFGIAGHSLGGTLALAAAAADERVRACCTNGGSVLLQHGLSKYPRVLQRFGRMLGDVQDPNRVLGFIEQLRLEEAAKTMRATLLCLHGGRDVLVADSEADHLVALRGAEAATLERWPEGVHCLYNLSVERNAVMTSWFASQLIEQASANITSSRRPS